MIEQDFPKEKKKKSIVKNEDFEREFSELKKIAEEAKKIYKKELEWKKKNLEN